jgi:hypothetical protein
MRRMGTLWPRVRGLVLFGWLVVLIRFALDATLKPEEWTPGWFVGVDILMPIAFLVVGIRGTMDDLPWPKYVLMALMLGLLVWGIPNAIVYTTAQFLEWTHGRFEPTVRDAAGKYVRGHAFPLESASAGKLGAGLKIAGFSSIFGFVGSLVLMTLLIWLPGVVRRRKRASARP